MSIAFANVRFSRDFVFRATLYFDEREIVPRCTSANPHSPTLMIAEKAAQWVLEEASYY